MSGESDGKFAGASGRYVGISTLSPEDMVAAPAAHAAPARRTPARRAPATPPPTKRVKVKREGEPRRSVRQVATPKTYNERHLEAAAWAGRGTRDDPFVAA